MTNQYYAKPYTDRRSRQAMADFLTAHDRHRDYLEPWKFAHDVKIWNLGIGALGCAYGQDPLVDMVHELIQDESFHLELRQMIESWEDGANGWGVDLEGRSGGWLALYPPDSWRYWHPAEPGNYMYSEEWPIHKLRELVAVVESFDRLADELRDHLLWAAENCMYIEEEVTYTRAVTVRKLVEKEIA